MKTTLVEWRSGIVSVTRRAPPPPPRPRGRCPGPPPLGSAPRPPAGRPCPRFPLALGRLARPDHDAPLGFFADAGARHVGVAFERKVDGPPLERLHGVERD